MSSRASNHPDHENAKVRLAICSAGGLFGGVERHILEFCRWLKTNGPDPLLILFHDLELASQARELGIKPVILGNRHLGFPQTINELGRLLATQKTQIVHAHGYLAVVACALAGRKLPVVLVRTVHGMVEPTPGPSLKHIKSKVYTRLEQFLSRRKGGATTFVSDELRSRHEDLEKGRLTRTINNGIHPLVKSDYPPPEDWDLSVPNLVVLGRLTEVKGLEFLLKALAGIDPHLKFQVHILGSGPSAGKLKQETRELGLADRVHFLGFRRDAYRFLANADALLMPSLHEGLPFTLLEAMSLEVPILASKVGGIGEILQDGETALLFPPANPEKLREAILVILSDPARLTKIVQQAHQCFLEDYQIDTMAGRYQDLYTSLLKESRT